MFQEYTGINGISSYFPDNSSVSYQHAGYSITNTNARPFFTIVDLGTEGTQCFRLSTWQSTAGGRINETYLQFKPAL